ncbi:UvrD-helicase domain-containing protein [Nocardioides zeae]
MPVQTEKPSSARTTDAAAKWRPTPGIVLEPNAERAVRTLVDNVAVPAGPGAGKTELLAQRANFLFTTGACPYPKRIIAISFKVDAAMNLRQRVAARCSPGDAARFDSLTFHAFARHIIARHRPHVADRVPPDFKVGPGRGAKQLHYDDLLPLALDVLKKDSSSVAILRRAYAYAFFDEFQDCTPDQFELLRSLFADSHVKATAVGDPKQRIMTFAGALEAALTGYVEDFGAETWPIYQNHRSLLRLRRVQNAMVKTMDPEAAVPDVELATPSHPPVDDGEVFVLRLRNTADEAVTLARMIEEGIRTGTRPDQIAVIVARNPGAYCEELMIQLARAGIACRNDQLHQDVLAEPAGALILDFVRLLVRKVASAEYVRLTEFMTRNCVDERQASRRRRNLDRFLERTREGLRQGAVDLNAPSQVRDLVYAFLRICERQYLSLLASEYSDREVLTAVASDAVSAVNDAIAETSDLAAAVARLSLEDAVRITNVHKCKGLEFDHVYCLGVEHEAYFGSLEIERPNFFVAISRARARLVLTTVSARPTPRVPPRRWDEARREHREFTGYASPERTA